MRGEEVRGLGQGGVRAQGTGEDAPRYRDQLLGVCRDKERVGSTATCVLLCHLTRTGTQGRRKGFGGGAAQKYPTCAAWSRGIAA